MGASLDDVFDKRSFIGIRLVQGDEGGATAKPGQHVGAQDARRLFGQDRAVGNSILCRHPYHLHLEPLLDHMATCCQRMIYGI